MHRIEGENVDVSTGVNLFNDDPPYTVATPAWMNSVQEEIMNVIQQAGLPILDANADKLYRNQLYTAITSLAGDVGSLDISDVGNITSIVLGGAYNAASGAFFASRAIAVGLFFDTDNNKIYITLDSGLTPGSQFVPTEIYSFTASDLKTDTINEYTTNNGVDIEGVNLKDNEINIPSGGEINHDGTPVAGYLDDGTPYYKKRFTIGSWDMDATSIYDVEIESLYGITEDEILNVVVWIYSDSSPTTYPSVFGNDRGGYIAVGTSGGNDKIQLVRTTGERFDSTAYDDTGIDRGFIIIEYTK